MVKLVLSLFEVESSVTEISLYLFVVADVVSNVVQIVEEISVLIPTRVDQCVPLLFVLVNGDLKIKGSALKYSVLELFESVSSVGLSVKGLIRCALN